MEMEKTYSSFTTIESILFGINTISRNVILSHALQTQHCQMRESYCIVLFSCPRDTFLEFRLSLLVRVGWHPHLQR